MKKEEITINRYDSAKGSIRKTQLYINGNPTDSFNVYVNDKKMRLPLVSDIVNAHFVYDLFIENKEYVL